MAAVPKTRFLTNDALTRKRWARDLFQLILPAVEFNVLTGKTSNDIVQMRMELGKGEGDKITFGIRLPLTGQGIVGQEPVEGNEEQLRFRDFSTTIEELNHAVDTGGKMEQQRVPYDLMVEGKDGLQEWWVDKLSDYMMAVLCGDTAFSIGGHTPGTGNTWTAISVPDVGHHMAVNGADGTAVATAEAALTSADTLDLTFLDRLKQRAEMPYGTAYKVRPIMSGGRKYWRVILHTYVFDNLRQNTNVAQWGDLLRNANKLQFPNVEIEYNGLLVSKSERISEISTAIYRNVLLGGQAAVWAWGGAGETKSSVMAFVPYEKDAKRFAMIRGGGIFGMAKTRFEDKDYGIITGSSYAVPLS